MASPNHQLPVMPATSAPSMGAMLGGSNGSSPSGVNLRWPPLNVRSNFSIAGLLPKPERHPTSGFCVAISRWASVASRVYVVLRIYIGCWGHGSSESRSISHGPPTPFSPWLIQSWNLDWIQAAASKFSVVAMNCFRARNRCSRSEGWAYGRPGGRCRRSVRCVQN